MVVNEGSGGMNPPSAVLEQVYGWAPAEGIDLLASFTSSAAAEVERRLHRQYSPDRPPSERPVAGLLAVVEEVLGELETDSGSQAWAATQQEVELPGGEVATLRCHHARVVLEQLRWACRVYSDVPGASAVIR